MMFKQATKATGDPESAPAVLTMSSLNANAAPAPAPGHGAKGKPANTHFELSISTKKMTTVVADKRGVGVPNVVRVSDSTKVTSEGSETSKSLKTSYTGPIIPPYQDKSFWRRTLVLCFDGTGDQFDLDNSNVIQFFSVLKKGDMKRQLVYYQSGIGTYTIPQVATPLASKFMKTLDLMFANQLHHHVMSGYKFLMQNYRDGDKICIFGFSRGAYTARALAGMIHKVGLLPAGNEQQVPFAYKMFTNDTERGWAQSVAFKKTFSMDVDIDFVGVWDTVASVGLFPTTLPFTKSNTAIKVFRHALSLDEHRTKFAPSVWQNLTEAEAKRGNFTPPPSQEASPTGVTRGRRRKDTKAVPKLDAPVPPPKDAPATPPKEAQKTQTKDPGSGEKSGDRTSTGSSFNVLEKLRRSNSDKGPGRRSESSSIARAREMLGSLQRTARNVSDNVAEAVGRVSLDLDRSLSRHTVNDSEDEHLSPDTEKDRLEQMYMDRGRPTDVLEVWFAGCHCDVGGGSVPNDTPNSLARIPLRWMIRECFLARTGIQFEAEKLRQLGLDPHTLYPRVVDDRPDWLKEEHARAHAHHDAHSEKVAPSKSTSSHAHHDAHSEKVALSKSMSSHDHQEGQSSPSSADSHTEARPQLATVQKRDRAPMKDAPPMIEIQQSSPHLPQAAGGHSRHNNSSLGATLVDFNFSESRESLDPPHVEVQGASVIDLTSMDTSEVASGVTMRKHNKDSARHRHAKRASDPTYLSSDHAEVEAERTKGIRFQPWRPSTTHLEARETHADSRSSIYDQLKLARWWWLLEFVPMRERRQKADGTWSKKWRMNRGRPRVVPQEEPLYVHYSVKMRMDDTALGYDPKLKFAKPPVFVSNSSL